MRKWSSVWNQTCASMLVNKCNCYLGEQLCAGLFLLLDISKADEIKMNAIFSAYATLSGHSLALLLTLGWTGYYLTCTLFWTQACRKKCIKEDTGTCKSVSVFSVQAENTEKQCRNCILCFKTIYCFNLRSPGDTCLRSFFHQRQQQNSCWLLWLKLFLVDICPLTFKD